MGASCVAWPLKLPGMRRLLRSVSIIALSAGCLTGASAALASSDPETDSRLGPADGAGHYFDGQSSTSRLHGCHLYDEQWYPTSLISGMPTTTPSTHRYVTFAVNSSSLPTFTWKAKSGYRICGVEAFGVLSGPTTGGGQYLAWFGYTSDAKSGATVAKGREKIKVHTPSDLAAGQSDLKPFAGKTLGIDGFQAVTVYVKKA